LRVRPPGRLATFCPTLLSRTSLSNTCKPPQRRNGYE